MSATYTWLCKTLLRPHSLERFVASALEHTPEAPIVVVDDGWNMDPDSRPSQELLDQVSASGEERGRYVTMKDDDGPGRCLMVGAQYVQTRWVVVVEDDMEVTPRTCVEALLHPLAADELDLAGGGVHSKRRNQLQDYVGHLEVAPDASSYRLRRLHVEGLEAAVHGLDVVLNFYACAPELIWRDVGMSMQLKVHRHMDWFLRLRQAPHPPPLRPHPSEHRARIGYIPGCVIDHHQDSTRRSMSDQVAAERYRKLRWNRQPQQRRQFLETWGLKDLPTVEG